MAYQDTITAVVNNYNDQQKKNGAAETNVHRAASLATIMLSRPVSPYEVGMIGACLSLARIPESASPASLIDAINDLSIVHAGIAQLPSIEEQMKGLVEKLNNDSALGLDEGRDP